MLRFCARYKRAPVSPSFKQSNLIFHLLVHWLAASFLGAHRFQTHPYHSKGDRREHCRLVGIGHRYCTCCAFVQMVTTVADAAAHWREPAKLLWQVQWSLQCVDTLAMATPVSRNHYALSLSRWRASCIRWRLRPGASRCSISQRKTSQMPGQARSARSNASRSSSTASVSSPPELRWLFLCLL